MPLTWLSGGRTQGAVAAHRRLDVALKMTNRMRLTVSCNLIRVMSRKRGGTRARPTANDSHSYPRDVSGTVPGVVAGRHDQDSCEGRGGVVAVMLLASPLVCREAWSAEVW